MKHSHITCVVIGVAAAVVGFVVGAHRAKTPATAGFYRKDMKDMRTANKDMRQAFEKDMVQS